MSLWQSCTGLWVLTEANLSEPPPLSGNEEKGLQDQGTVGAFVCSGNVGNQSLECEAPERFPQQMYQDYSGCQQIPTVEGEINIKMVRSGFLGWRKRWYTA